MKRMRLFGRPLRPAVCAFRACLPDTDGVSTATIPDKRCPCQRRRPPLLPAFAAVQGEPEAESPAQESAQPQEGLIGCSNGDDLECIAPNPEFSHSSMSPSA